MSAAFKYILNINKNSVQFNETFKNYLLDCTLLIVTELFMCGTTGTTILAVRSLLALFIFKHILMIIRKSNIPPAAASPVVVPAVILKMY